MRCISTNSNRSRFNVQSSALPIINCFLESAVRRASSSGIPGGSVVPPDGESPVSPLWETSSKSSSSSATGGKQATPPPAASATTLYTPEMENNKEVKEKVIQYLISRDKELFDLKRQHELALLRIEQGQNRALKFEQEKDSYTEQSVNVTTFEELSVSHYTRRNSFYLIAGVAQLRQIKTWLTVGCTLLLWVYFYYKYIVNPEKQYVKTRTTLYGSQYSLYKRLREEKELESLNKVA